MTNERPIREYIGLDYNTHVLTIDIDGLGRVVRKKTIANMALINRQGFLSIMVKLIISE